MPIVCIFLHGKINCNILYYKILFNFVIVRKKNILKAFNSSVYFEKVNCNQSHPSFLIMFTIFCFSLILYSPYSNGIILFCIRGKIRC